MRRSASSEGRVRKNDRVRRKIFAFEMKILEFRSIFETKTRLGGIYWWLMCYYFINEANCRSINLSLPVIPDVIHPPLPGK